MDKTMKKNNVKIPQLNTLKQEILDRQNDAVPIRFIKIKRFANSYDIHHDKVKRRILLNPELWDGIVAKDGELWKLRVPEAFEIYEKYFLDFNFNK